MTTPRLTRDKFLDYIRAFNARDYETQHAFYSDSVTLTIPDPAIGTVHGLQAISEHYAIVHSLAEETIVPMVVIAEDDHVFFVMETYFKYFKDTDEAVHSYTVKAGDVLRMTVWALYDIDSEGKMAKIVCNLVKEEFLGAVDIRETVKESESRSDAHVRIHNLQ